MTISNDATTPNTVIDVSAGLCRDSTNTFDINLGNWFGSVPAPANANVVTTINAAINGAGGLDTGSLAASKVYYVHVIFDQTGNNLPNCIVSLSRTAPLLPAGYSNFRWIGQMVTDSSSHFLLAYNYGNQNERKFRYDAPISVGTTSSSSSYANIDLTKFVPLINNIPVALNVSFSGTAADLLKLQPGNATGDAIVIEQIVTSQAQTSQVTVLAQTVAISTVPSPVVNYKNSGTDTVVINVAGFDYSL